MDRPITVALDVTPLLGPRTGVGEFCAGALAALSGLPSLVAPRAYAVTWRRRDRLAGQVPDSVPVAGRPMPARPVQRIWRALDRPAIEWWAGPVDVVHGTNFVVPPARRAARVATVHDLTALRYPELCEPVSRSFPALVRRALDRGAWVHTPSAFVASEVAELLGADPERVRAVHHGVPTLRRPGWARTCIEPDGPRVLPARGPYVLALGTIEPRKDYPGLVEAFDLLAGDHPELWLVLAGPDGWGAPALDAALGAASVARRVVRLGYVSEARRSELLGGAAAFAYPSLYEGFGFPPLEAMAAGVPVVTTDAGALPEVVGNAARVVPARDPVALAGALEEVLYDTEVRGELIERGRCRVAQFSWDACAAGLAALYRDAAATRR